jgi:hypothetical protein
MYNQQYVTITHYKEREFYFLNHAIQTNDGFITKDSEQFHETEKEKFIERIRELQAKYPKNQVISLSLAANQVVKEKEDPNQACARIFKENYVVQEKMDIGNIPVTLYFSPFAVLYEEYKHKLGNKLTLMIGLFDRKLFIMFATEDKIHQSWTLGTRGLTEKQIADRVYKSMKAYYKISYKFADQIEMLVSDDSPKLLKVLREELSMSILPTQKTIHQLLHYMGADQSRFTSSYIKSFLAASQPREAIAQPKSIKDEIPVNKAASLEEAALHSLDDIRLNSPESSMENNEKSSSFLSKVKSFSAKNIENKSVATKAPFKLTALLPLLFVLGAGGYFSLQNTKIEQRMHLAASQSYAQTNNALLAMTSKDIFDAMGKSAELKSATISNDNIELKGVVWGIEPLRNALNELYNNGEFVIKPLENFMTEFSFKSKV